MKIVQCFTVLFWVVGSFVQTKIRNIICLIRNQSTLPRSLRCGYISVIYLMKYVDLLLVKEGWVFLVFCHNWCVIPFGGWCKDSVIICCFADVLEWHLLFWGDGQIYCFVHPPPLCMVSSVLVNASAVEKTGWWLIDMKNAPQTLQWDAFITRSWGWLPESWAQYLGWRHIGGIHCLQVWTQDEDVEWSE